MTKRLKFLSNILISLFITSCNGQVQTKPSKSIKVKPVEYNAGDVVTEGLLDKSGNIWFTSTSEGVFKYDGKTFTNITEIDGLCSNQVWSVVDGKDGLLWFATDKGLCSYDGENFTNVPLPQEGAEDVSPETGFPSKSTQVVLSLIQDRNGYFWLGTNSDGAYRYDGKTFTSFLKFHGRVHPDYKVYNNCITNIIEDKNGNIWFTSITHGGISRYDGASLTHFTTKDGLLGDMTNASFEDKAGNIWFGSIQNLDGGLMRYDGKNFRGYTKKDGLCDSNVASFYEDESGKLWIGTGNGVCYFDGKTFTPFDNDGQSLGDIRFIIKDNEGNMWFGGRYGVLYRYDGNDLEDFTHKKRGN
jgi:ligand-binding sensor domain-containing protein